MQELSKFKDLITDVWQTPALGSDVGTWVTVVLIFLFFVFLRGVFARVLISKLNLLTSKTKSRLDDEIFQAVEKPISLLPVVIGLFIATSYLDLEGRLSSIIYSIEKSLIAIVLFWSLHNMMDPLSVGLNKLEKIFSKPMVTWLRKGIKLLIFFIGVATVLEIWGIQVAPIVAGLGLFGVAVALGAQDMFKNLISGLTIIAEKRFQPGDWILVDGVVEGTVEDIGFRSTQVRRFDKAPVHVPNAKLSDSAVTNFSAMTHRRIYWKIGLTYSSTIDQLKDIRNGIEDYILNTAAFAKPEDAATFVRIDSFNSSSIDIMLYCFTNTTVWGEWLEIKEQLAYKVKDIVEGAKGEFAFPSQSLYVEALPGDGPEVFVPPAKKKAVKKATKKKKAA